MKKHKRLSTSFLLLFAGLILQVLSRSVDGFGQWYSENVYPILVNSIGRMMNLFPFSVSEAGIYILVIGIIFMIVKMVRHKEFHDFVLNIIFVASVLFFLYCSNCGVNYYRISFAESEGFDAKNYSLEELKETCVWLTEEVNYWASKVKRDENEVMVLSVDERSEAVHAMEDLGEIYSVLEGYYPRPKKLLNHWILSVQKLSGIYSPFTIEANYNGEMTDYNIPLTACHELSHLRGFMQEEEANFIAFLACSESKEADFQYGGYMLGWIHCMNLLYRTDYEAWEEIRVTLSEVVEPDLKANSRFWDKYDGTVAEVADRVNDTYLKVNGQNDGVESYGRMADLIVIYYRDRVN